MAATEFTSINRSWSVKMYIFLIVLVGFGSWGLLDALVWYPRRGIEDASYKQREYLEYVAQNNSYSSASIADPVARLKELKAREAELAEADADSRKVTPGGSEYRALLPKLVDLGAKNWLNSLRLVGRLTPEYTKMANPSATLAELRDKWKTTARPNPLTEFDLPLQWIFAAVGYGLGLYMLMIIVRVMRTKYGWDAATQELTLPSGRSFRPEHLAEVDKRKWDKFYVTLNLKDGSSHRLDLLRYVPLEDWVLAMERTAFPETATEPSTEPAAGAATDSGAGSQATA